MSSNMKVLHDLKSDDLEHQQGTAFICAPILILGFNRPDLARQQFRNIAPYKPAKVFFAVDGGRTEEERELCKATQSAVKEIGWSCELKTFFREENRSCRDAPPEAISWFFENVDYGIILEDDCYPAPGFLRFATELLERYRHDERVVFFDDYLTQRDVLNLTNACDVYLSLHRAEGFGLGIAEAMSLGKSVIVTDYSSTTEFCNAANSIPVGYKIVKMDESDNKLYSAAEKWAEPDVDEAAQALSRLYADPKLRAALGTAARESILAQYSVSNFRESVWAYLSEEGK